MAYCFGTDHCEFLAQKRAHLICHFIFNQFIVLQNIIMSKIYDFPVSFNLLRRYVLFMFKRYYSDFIVVGKENIPENTPLIFAPNHVNALMDAIAVHAVVPRNLPLIFLARADIFRNITAARFLRFTKILPAFRMRDGIEKLGNNADIFNQCIEILHNNAALGIMPEGNQEIERKLQTLVKGIFRIGFAAQQKFGTEPGVKIIPIGLDYGSIFKSQKHIIISVGKAIEVSEYMNLYSENQVKATNELREKLRNDLSDITLNLATDLNYESFEYVVSIVQKPVLEDLKLADTIYNRFVARQNVAQRLVTLEKNLPLEMLKLNDLSFEYQKLLSQLNLNSKSIENAKPKKSIFGIEMLMLLVSIPAFVSGFILNFAPFFSPVYIRKYIMKTKYNGFFSSLQFGLSLLTFPFFYFIQTLLFWAFVSSLWWAVLLFFVAQYPLGKLALSCYKKAVKWWANIRLLNLSKEKTIQLKEAEVLYNQIVEIILMGKN